MKINCVFKEEELYRIYYFTLNNIRIGFGSVRLNKGINLTTITLPFKFKSKEFFIIATDTAANGIVQTYSLDVDKFNVLSTVYSLGIQFIIIGLI